MTFRLEGDLTKRLDQFGPHAKRSMVAAAGYTATQAESFMRSQAPWTDRTGAARNGLRSQVVVSSNKVAIVLYHSVAYGPYLEVRWGGKYGILLDTVAAAGPLFVETIGRLMFDEGGAT